MKPSLLVLCLILLGGCASQPSMHSLVGTWKMKEANSYLRFYPDGRAAKWPQGREMVTVWATYNQSTITFHDWDGNLIRRDSALILQSETGEELFYRLGHDVEPPPRPNQSIEPIVSRRTIQLCMNSIRQSATMRALARASSSWSR